ncbi:uncharacterized protein LOC114448621 isoform X2 [Parambassis ranga]|uniref:Uncharacterized protein LOC114448621 isoform X2 n=1 Tax=Parambassis ranga TaxID=210632 RepID=A0A6P7JWY1_9TELE|nr:uncharacterized protein LOC114448621 isoform X2 [Parambassis ranga]
MMTSAVVIVLLCVLGQIGSCHAANIARAGKVTQSTQFGDPKMAIDGNRTSIFDYGSCTHTTHDQNPWWRLDLMDSFKIDTVTITNRQDCCHERLNGAEIRIGNSLNDNGNANPRCAVITTIQPGSTQSFDCNGMRGRYVNIMIPGRKEYLTLCEVEVYSGLSGENIALRGSATQSSPFWYGPERAIDGNRGGFWNDGACTHTSYDRNPWWRLDLLDTYTITSVTITNRRDCCHERLNGAEIRIGNSLNDNGNANPSCAVITTIPAGTTQTFECNGMEGRYVNIVIPGRREFLTLCEVEVDSEPKRKVSTADTIPAANIARGGRVTQSSQFGDPKLAIDGNQGSIWGDGICTHTGYDQNPWWRLDLMDVYKINTITIINRRDCCHERLNGAEIRIGNSLSDNGNANPRCAVITTILAGATVTFECNGMEGRYVNIVIPGRKEYLTLCEVEVYSTLSAENIARGGRVTQSSQFGDPKLAIDGNQGSIWGDGICTHTGHDQNPWWRLDLLDTYKINTVTITNRQDCCDERLNGAEIRIGNILTNDGNNNPRCAVITSIPAGATQTFECNGMEGRYVNIVIPGRKEYLTLCELEVNSEPKRKVSTTDIIPAANIARGGRVTQSSQFGDPKLAIDGNQGSIWGDGICTHTGYDQNPWWRLDLMDVYKINTITIINRRDCCHERLNGAEIRIGNSLKDNGNANPRCAVITTILAGATVTFECNGMEGRYVNIVIPGRKEYLTLCEVEVYSTLSAANIARGGRVTQSSQFGDPKLAIDGNQGSIWGDGICTHTGHDQNPWWRLDLLDTYKINTVTITNRQDCCDERLNGAEIRIGNILTNDGNNNPRCAVITSIPAGATQTFECNGMEGRYVNIVIPGRKEYLTLCEVEVNSEPKRKVSTTDIIPAANIARGGRVTQSSQFGDPKLAIDGNQGSIWGDGICTHTGYDQNPWWRLDLMDVYKINTITIINRRDCCHERLNGAEIRIGNSLKDNGNANPRCAVITTILAGATVTFECNGMEGRYVNIVIPGRKEYLTLCEVEVYSTLSAANIARGGRVTQSSQFGDPKLAIDGNQGSIWGDGICTHTGHDQNPWWRLDLLDTYKINTVTITNRQDCCDERLNGAEIRIGNILTNDGNNNPRCAVITSIPAGATQTFECNGMEGRYVNIVIPGRKEYLTLCEVEVNSEPKRKVSTTDIIPAANIARGGRVTQSSQFGDPKLAIDGNQGSIWGDGICTHTGYDQNPWWRLDLMDVYKINTITIINRRDCCHERLNGAEIRIGNSLKDNGNANPRCAVITTILAGATVTFECNGMEGRYVNIVIPGRKEYLTLCEVEVYSTLSAANIARGGRVTQSSQFGDPKLAIDGNQGSIWGDGICTHTGHDQNPWWRLDLLDTYKINTVTITNRQDCCDERLNGAEIRIGNILTNDGNNNPRCAVITSIPAGATQTFECNGMEGRYVNIVIPGRKEYLTLCEVEVNSEPKRKVSTTDIIPAANIARGGRVTQSSQFGDPKLAIDGNQGSIWGDGICTHTGYDQNPWWRLDLMDVYKINTITIINRRDCCHERLNGAEIRIGNSLNDNGNANPRCAVITTILAGATVTFECNGMEGRYVNIVIPGRKEYLTLCEVEVYSTLSAENIARGGRVTQSSQFGDPKLAIDGNQGSIWGDGICTHTGHDQNPWWRLDLLDTYKINTVTITNRQDCCDERLNGAEIRIGNILTNDGNNNPRCAVITSIPAGATQTFECNGMEGRYVNIVIPGRKEYLTLCEVEVNSQLSATNIARVGRVTQSSLYGAPESAIDGNRASIWDYGSCTHTGYDQNPWWRLDLQGTYNINTVIITNRQDCCPERLSGAEIRIGNSLRGNGNANPRCAVITSIPAGATKTFECNGMEGRYVNIVIPGRKEYLTLCEVEVYSTLSSANIARGGRVTQSSQFGDPEMAIDGSRASIWGEGSCTHTGHDQNPWWRLDLLDTYIISSVTITNRQDCCHERLNGAEIQIGNSLSDNDNANPRCAVITSIPAGATKTFRCNEMEGRYVNIVIPGRKEFLTLCEVEVNGVLSAKNIARDGRASQSSLFGGAARAIDGNHDSDWQEGSCTHTGHQQNPWWRLDLLDTSKINTVTITNRQDCCHERLNGAEIRIGNSLIDNGNANPRCAVITTIPPGDTRTFECNGMEGRYVNIVIPGRKEYLTLCEVEVNGQHPAGRATQSSVFANAVAETAIDGNRASIFSESSCTHTSREDNPWWSVDLLNTYKITSVTVTNRKDCCPERLNGAEIRIGNSLSDNGNANPRCAVITSIPAGATQTFECNGMEGRYVNIVIPGRKEYLTLCEVEVSGELVESEDITWSEW